MTEYARCRRCGMEVQDDQDSCPHCHVSFIKWPPDRLPPPKDRVSVEKDLRILALGNGGLLAGPALIGLVLAIFGGSLSSTRGVVLGLYLAECVVLWMPAVLAFDRRPPMTFISPSSPGAFREWISSGRRLADLAWEIELFSIGPFIGLVLLTLSAVSSWPGPR